MAKKRKAEAAPERESSLPKGYTAVGGKAVAMAEGEWVAGVFKRLIPAQVDERGRQTLGAQAIVEVDGEPMRYWAPAVLAARLEMVPVDSEIFIACRGKLTTKAGREAWDFEVGVKGA